MYSRFAVFVVPDGVWGDFGAEWLGWDNRVGASYPQFDPIQTKLTDRPRKYGFHGTLKPPFRLQPGKTVEGLEASISTLCAGFTPFTLDSFQFDQIGRFFAMTAPDDRSKLRAVADVMVQELDMFRAPLKEDDLARRRGSGLSDQHEDLLQAWGYPYVLEAFKFHMTLTGPSKDPEAARNCIAQHLKSVLSEPIQIDSVCLLGENADTGRFHVINRFAFTS